MSEYIYNRRKTDDWLPILAESMSDGLCAVDANGYITYVNPGLCAITGYAREALTGYPITRFFDDTNRNRLLQYMEAHARGVFEPYELGFARSDGRTLVIHVTPHPLAEASGKTGGSFAVIKDITGRKRAEEQLRKLSAAIEQSPVGVMITDTSGTIEYVNQSLCQLTGYTTEELIGQNPSLLQSGLTPAETYRSLWSSLLEGHEWRGELRDKKKNGDLYWCYDVISGIKDEQGTVTHYMALQKDITDRKLAEEALRQSEKKYSLLVENSLIGIYIVQDGRFVYANRQCAAIFGYAKDELIGREFLPFIIPQDRQRIGDQMAKWLSGKRERGDRLTSARTQNGDVILLKQNWANIHYRGKPAIQGNVMDITREKQTEERLEESTKQLRALSQQLLEVLEQERKRVASELHDGIGQYLSSLKFSLHNVTPDGCRAEMAKGRTPPCAGVVPLLQEAIEEVRLIAADLRPAILDDLGIVATINWFCRRAQASYPDLTISKHIEAEESDVPEPVKLVIFRVLQEAINNAAKHAHADTVQVRLEKAADKLTLTIADNGRGFDVAHALRRKSAEKGLGLVSMRQRVKFSGGQLAIHSSIGQGTVISASWPTAELNQPPAAPTTA